MLMMSLRRLMRWSFQSLQSHLGSHCKVSIVTFVLLFTLLDTPWGYPYVGPHCKVSLVTMILLITLLDTPWVYLSICEGSKTASGFTHFYTCLSFQCLGAFINIKVINNTLRISRRLSPILFLVFILKACMMFCQRPKTYEFHTIIFRLLQSNVFQSHLISFPHFSSFFLFQNSETKMQTKGQKQTKNKRRREGN